MKTDSCLLIQRAKVLCLDEDNTFHEQADILIEKGRITAIGQNLSRLAPPNIKKINAKGMLAMPGLINSHFHSPGSFLKGQLDNYPLELFMLFEVPAINGNGDMKRYSYLCTQLAVFEMLQRGITTVHDDAYHIPAVTRDSIDAIMEAYLDSGIRATVAIDQPNLAEYEKLPFLRQLLPDELIAEMNAAPIQTTEELLDQYHYLIERWHGEAEGRLNAAVSCSAPQRVSEDYIQALSKLSNKYDLPFNLHILETKLQRVLGEEKFGKSLVRLIHDQGILDERCQIIHSIWVDDHDIELMASAGCVVAHNPVCNLRLGSGVMPYAQLHDAGVPISIGTDELCSDDTTNLWFAGKMAALIHTLSDKDYNKWPKAPEILKSLTKQGARSIRKEGELGQLSPGYLADIIVLDLDTWSFTPMNDMIRQLVYCEDGSSVRYTIVNGEIVYEKGRFPGVDVSSLRKEIYNLQSSIETMHSDTLKYANRVWPYYNAMYDTAHAKKTGLQRRLVVDD